MMFVLCAFVGYCNLLVRIMHRVYVKVIYLVQKGSSLGPNLDYAKVNNVQKLQLLRCSPTPLLYQCLGEFANCGKRLSASSCLSVRPHGTTLFPLDGFSLNLIFEHFSKICRENSSFH